MKQRNSKINENCKNIFDSINKQRLLGNKLINKNMHEDENKIQENDISPNQIQETYNDNELYLKEDPVEILPQLADSLHLIKQENNTNERMIDYIDNNENLKLLFSKYDNLKDELVYNKNYEYKIFSPDLSSKLIDSNWDNIQYIFRNNKLKPPTFKSIKDIKKITKSNFLNGRLVYEVSIEGINKHFTFRIEDCLSKELFFLVQEYLFIEIIGKKTEISNSVKYFEISSFFYNFKSKIQCLDIKDCIIPGIAKRSNKINPENKVVLQSIDLKSIKNIYLTNEKTLIYYVKLDKGNFYLTESELESKLDDQRKDLLQDMLFKKQIIPRYERTNEITYLYRNNSRQYSKDNKKKFKAKLKADREKNYNNCLIHALQIVYNCFKVYKYKNEFRTIGFEAQLIKANSILLANWKKPLNFNEIIKTNLGQFVDKIKGVVMIIYYEKITEIHADIIKNGRLLGDRSENLIALSNKDVSLIVIEIEDHDIEHQE